MAIPYNIIYKVVTGNSPFQGTLSISKPGAKESLGAPADDANVARGVVTVISGLWISITDLTITANLATKANWVKRTVTSVDPTELRRASDLTIFIVVLTLP